VDIEGIEGSAGSAGIVYIEGSEGSALSSAEDEGSSGSSSGRFWRHRHVALGFRQRAGRFLGSTAVRSRPAASRQRREQAAGGNGN
jgi:hypothetical protein